MLKQILLPQNCVSSDEDYHYSRHAYGKSLAHFCCAWFYLSIFSHLNPPYLFAASSPQSVQIGMPKKSAKFSLSCIDKWISPTKKQVPLLFYPSKGVVQPEPLGLVLIFSSFKARLLPLHIDNCLDSE
ncbi:hypothetical protein POM88_003916 [Heracleum sosnowskyi]|uniref:Uncharacterized protein n=1 Tax=Heracleum sosnowskyi TaxID=360622 RepID=A0AAD8NDH6_9APIA|nr:hypothetical protein POM88_003916 [Heracleum sosnowskyi]